MKDNILMKPTKKYLIVNADDFGLTDEVNDGIIRAYQDGIVTSASIMPTGKAFDHAVMLARQNEGLEIGVHLTLTQENPVLAYEDVASLLEKSNKFYKNWNTFVFRFLLGRLEESEIDRELDAQITKVFKAGLRPTYLDSHQHIHVIPRIWTIMSKLAKKYKIKFTRHPKEIKLAGCMSVKQFLKILSIRSVLKCLDKKSINDFKYSDHFVGIGASGRITTSILEKYLSNLKEGVTELMCHPGSASNSGLYKHWNYQWRRELEALINPDILALVKQLNIKLINRGGIYE